jgi:hypothetical protein
MAGGTPALRLQAQQVEISSSFLNVFCNLLAQSFDGRELDLIPQAIQEKQFNLGLGP